MASFARCRSSSSSGEYQGAAQQPGVDGVQHGAPVGLPLDGLRVAAARAQAEGFVARASVLAAAASRLPFRAGSFDAIIHTDVLC